MTKMLVNFDGASSGDILAIGCDIAGFNYCDHCSILVKDFTAKSKATSTKMLSLTINDFTTDFLKLDQSHDKLLEIFDYIKLEVPFHAVRDALDSIERLARKKQVIAEISGCEQLSDLLALLPYLVSRGIFGVMLVPQHGKGKLEHFPKSVKRFSDKKRRSNNGLERRSDPIRSKCALSEQFSIVDIGIFIEECHKNGLAACLFGGIEAPDIARLLPYSPDILCFDIEQFLSNGIYNKQQGDLIRSLIPHETENVDYKSSANLGTDRILVNNFVLPMAIGAYNHERNRLQKVRFSVAADVLRLSVNPEDMRHIFSYDLIIDGIKRLALLGHVELVETLAERIAAFILSYPRVQKVIVRVEKLELEPEAVGIEIERVKKKH